MAATGDKGATVRVFSAVALVVAATLALVAWGLLHSVKIDTAESQLDAAIEDAIAAGTDLSCDCGHEHDPNELHVSDTCAHDGSGAKCSHDCDSCVLAAMRPSPTPPRTERLTR